MIYRAHLWLLVLRSAGRRLNARFRPGGATSRAPSLVVIILILILIIIVVVMLRSVVVGIIVFIIHIVIVVVIFILILSSPRHACLRSRVSL